MEETINPHYKSERYCVRVNARIILILKILESEVEETNSFARPVHRLGLSRLAETSALHLYALKMSHPTPTEKPSNPANPRVFFDVDIDGEQGKRDECF